MTPRLPLLLALAAAIGAAVAIASLPPVVAALATASCALLGYIASPPYRSLLDLYWLPQAFPPHLAWLAPLAWKLRTRAAMIRARRAPNTHVYIGSAVDARGAVNHWILYSPRTRDYLRGEQRSNNGPIIWESE